MINGGTIIIYDDSPKTIANEAINILKNKNYRRKLGKEAKKSIIHICSQSPGGRGDRVYRHIIIWQWRGWHSLFKVRYCF